MEVASVRARIFSLFPFFTRAGVALFFLNPPAHLNPGLAAVVRYGISVSHAAIKAIPPYGASFPFDLSSEGAQGAGWFAYGRI